MKKWLTVLLGILLVVVLAACTADENAGEEGGGEDGEESTSEDSSVLRMNNGAEPTSLDPPIGFDAASWNVLNNLMEGMTRLSQEHEPEEATAENIEVSEDGTEYTFTIREDAKWSNGDDVSAEDFEFAWKRLLDPETASAAAFLGYFIEGGEEFNNGEGSADDVMVEAVDDKELHVTLTAPTNYFLNIISNPAFFPINKEVAEEDEEWFTEAESFVGNGPFSLTEWEHDNEMVLEKNEEYWDAETVQLEEVHFAMVDDSNTEYQLYDSGDLDNSEIPSDSAEELLESDEVTIEDQAGTQFYRFNVEEEPFQNEKIRKAFALAINQEDIVNYVTKMGEEPARGFVSPGFNDANGNDFREESGDLVQYDAEEAKQLLEEGKEEEGYDELPEVTLSYNTDDTNKSIAESMQEMYSQNLGVDVSLENTEWNVFLEDQKALEHQFSRSSFLADYADPINFLESFTTDSSMNRTGWSNKEYDNLIAQAKEETDEEQRFQHMYEAEQILFEEMPIFPIHFYNQVFLQKDNVDGIVRHPVGYLELKWATKE
ncbi:peptide ABC transporter substrate-binding protein [Halobacillus sp. A1]|uniref:peptide ABC transporter substrate-binding protein n=1 Tax=Halobacillus sp. A1 TaxID=2880262 RepID=UPI0020A64030|nr:peptide ABC transporter substrate-binding protein [Halobacillus sp. A1]MCP3030277.1 peptide ABC transporter substrate-binding protein [Halobacillus sp. A1]